MGTLKKNYFFRGLDTRTNKLYREDGTASDCRNVRLDSTRKLIKRNDMDITIIPRAADGVTGEFLTELPFSAEILDIMPYEDFFILATALREEPSPGVYKDCNKFYKWEPVGNIVEFIPFEKEVHASADYGQLVYKNGSDMEGSFMNLNQENILYFIGNQYPDFTDQDFTYNSEDQEYNRSEIFTYDGKVIGRSGCPDNYSDTTEDVGTQATDEYVRMLPMKIDNLGRHTFGTFSTHLGTNVDLGGGDRGIELSVTPEDKSYDYNACLEINQGSGGVILNAADSAPLRTIDVLFFERSGTYKSAGKGQILYGIDYDYIAINVGFPPTARSITESYKFYRCTVEEVDYVGNTATLGEFKTYNDDTGLWEDSAQFRHTGSSGLAGSRPPFLSNIIYCLYGSDDFAFGYRLRGFVTAPYGFGTVDFRYATDKAYSGGLPLTGPVDINYNISEIFLWITKSLSDMYDTSTTKLPPPKVRHLNNYLGAMVCVDEALLYFSDFSLGGNIEIFTPFDNFPFGSSKRGPVTGVFANETFLVGFREQEAYYITGNIFTLNYRIQSYKSTRIGCSDPRSITDYRGAGIFASEKGLFVAMQGGAMEELSDKLENIFTDNALGLDLNQFDVKTVVDFKREYIYFSIESGLATQDHIIIAYSYYHNEWYLYDGISGNGGFDMFNDRLYASDGTNIYIESDVKLEADAYWRSNFETLGVPSFEKKFHQALLFTIDSLTDHIIGIKTYKNWDSDEAITDEEKDIEAGQVDMTQRFNPGRSKSVAIEISSESGQELTVNGFEYEFEADVSMFKNDDN